MHRTQRGTIRYTSDQPDRVRVVHAHSEIDDAPSVVRDVVMAIGASGRPLDAHVRLTVGGRFEGVGFFRFSEHAAECEAFNRSAGRTHQQVELDAPVRGLGAHPICGDALLLRLYDLGRGPGREFYPHMMLTSPDHRGATGPALFALGFGIEYVGPDRITVPAGSFDALHFRYVDIAGGLSQEHPPYDVWCTADGDYVFLRGTVGGYMQTRYELLELLR